MILRITGRGPLCQEEVLKALKLSLHQMRCICAKVRDSGILCQGFSVNLPGELATPLKTPIYSAGRHLTPKKMGGGVVFNPFLSFFFHFQTTKNTVLLRNKCVGRFFCDPEVSTELFEAEQKTLRKSPSLFLTPKVCEET